MMNFSKNLFVLIALAAYSLVAGETFVRVFAPQAFVPRNIMAAPYGVRMNTPNARYSHRTPEVAADVHINGQGLRAPIDFSIDKKDNISRIAIFGDSYFLGYEGAYKDIAATQLERRLNQAKCPVEVLNFSVSGFGTGEMLRTFEKKALAFNPDVVIFQWHHTDTDDNRRSGLYALENGRLTQTGADYVPAIAARKRLQAIPAYQFLANNSHLFIAIREKLSRTVRRAMAGRVFTRNTAADLEESDADHHAGAIDLAILARAEELAISNGARFYVVEVPGVQARTRFRTSFRLLPASLIERPNYISPINEFNAAASLTEKLYWERGHRHLTPKGNALIAEVMADHLLGDAQTVKALSCSEQKNDARVATRQ